ncbi:MAG: histidine phosphatase family protein [Rhodoferax sp.]
MRPPSALLRHARYQVCALALCSLLGSAQAADTLPSPAPFVERFADRALLTQMQHGGFVLYMRHGTTDNSRADQAPRIDLSDCRTQRQLNSAGRKMAVDVGQALREAKIPVSSVLYSPLCRTRETAELAFPNLRLRLQPENNLAYSANLTSEEKKPVLAATRKLLSEPVPAGNNLVVVAHAPNMADLIGYFVKPEGTVVVIRPLGDGRFEYVASIPPALWAQLREPPP